MSCNACASFRYSAVPKVHLGVLHLARKRPWPSCVNPDTGRQWSDDMKAQILSILKEKTDFELVRIDEKVLVNDDPSLREALVQCFASEVDVLLAIQPMISDGRLAPVLAQQWAHTVVFWATPEEQTGKMISGNSLVGAHLMMANLRQLGFNAQFVYGNLDWHLAEAQLKRAVAIAFAERYLKKAKVGLIGYQAPGFQDFHPNPPALQKTFGVILLQLGLSEYAAVAQTFEEVALERDARVITQDLKLPFGDDLGEKDMAASSRHYLAMKQFISDNNLDGLAVRCWPELPGPPSIGNTGLDQWCYMALARLATEGFPIACEGDVDGAVGGMVAKFLGCGTVYLSDWLEHTADTLTLWHGGMAPMQVSDGGMAGHCAENLGWWSWKASSIT